MISRHGESTDLDCDLCRDRAERVGDFFQVVVAGNKALVEGYFKFKDSISTLTSAKDANGNTVLHIAACHGYEEIIKILINHGADPRVKNNDGFIPKECASATLDGATVDLLDPKMNNIISKLRRISLEQKLKSVEEAREKETIDVLLQKPSFFSFVLCSSGFFSCTNEKDPILTDAIVEIISKYQK